MLLSIPLKIGQTSWGEWEITEAIEHEKFLERNQFALEVIRIRKLINLPRTERLRNGAAEKRRRKMSSIIHTFLII